MAGAQGDNSLGFCVDGYRILLFRKSSENKNTKQKRFN